MSDPEGLSFVSRRATLPEHRALADAVGWSDHFDWDSLPDSLARSLHGEVAVVDNEVVGMGRLVGDGVHYFYIQDVIVHPDHMDSGIGSTIVDRLIEWVANAVPSRAFVGLFASDEAIPLYRRYGFGTGEMTGMHRFVDPA